VVWLLGILLVRSTCNLKKERDLQKKKKGESSNIKNHSNLWKGIYKIHIWARGGQDVFMEGL